MGLGQIVRWSNIEDGKAEVLAWNREPRNEQWGEYNTQVSTLARLVDKDDPTEHDENLFYRTLRTVRELRTSHIKTASIPVFENGWVWVVYAVALCLLYMIAMKPIKLKI